VIWLEIKVISDPDAAYTLPNGEKTRLAFLAGAGGVGKTFIYTALNHYARWKGLLGHNSAFSGIAATLLPRGRTVHNLFGLPIPILRDSNSAIELGTKAARELKNSAYVLIDEAPMLPKHALECANRKLKEIERLAIYPESEDPFGNHAIILGGDYCQTLPVVRGGSRSQKVNSTVKSSYLWPKFKTFKLTKNLRANADAQEFAKFIRNVGRGIPNFDEPDGYCRLPEEVCTKRSLAKKIFRPLLRAKDYAKANETAILAPLNEKVEEINEEILDMLEDEEERSFFAQDATDPEHEAIIMPDMLNSLRSAGLPPYKLRLRTNAIVMLLRNLNIPKGLCNGTRLQILEMKNHVLKAMILTGEKKGDIVLIPRITVTDDQSFPFPVHRHQFPVKLAYAMTINKAQGQTFNRLGIDLTLPVFDHGQLYTALSRAKCWESITVRLPEDAEDTLVANIVFDEILDDLGEDDEEFWDWAAAQYLHSIRVNDSD
jgi:PIF1-like helicase